MGTESNEKENEAAAESTEIQSNESGAENGSNLFEGATKAVNDFEQQAVIKALWKQVWQACGCVAVGTAVMIGIFALCSAFSVSVLLGGLLGMVNAMLYWILLCLSQTTPIKIPYLGRMLVLLGILILGLNVSCFHDWAVIIPLVFTKPLAYIFLIIEVRKK